MNTGSLSHKIRLSAERCRVSRDLLKAEREARLLRAILRNMRDEIATFDGLTGRNS